MHKLYLDILFFIKDRQTNIEIGFWENIQIYSGFQEFTNKYSNKFGCPKIYKWISKYIHTAEMAQIRIRMIFESHFIRIFEYSCSSLIQNPWLLFLGCVLVTILLVLHWKLKSICCTSFTIRKTILVWYKFLQACG